ncbi:c-type cytochrome [Paraburkholderia kururiensis]|uniref:c-type cytochrome n=1 Tax=Paraburkholderia kururiensis TaxID=984307 RepID=UPI0005A70182|nr:c-type cytochrome [Paraburkholderia kururiensis]
MKRESHAVAALAAALAGLFVAPGAVFAEQVASQGLALAQQQNCTSCHAMTRPFMGPALHDIALKYASRSDAATYLAHKIIDGSSGVWGRVPMPANTQLTPDQAVTLANWILSLK